MRRLALTLLMIVAVAGWAAAQEARWSAPVRLPALGESGLVRDGFVRSVSEVRADASSEPGVVPALPVPGGVTLNEAIRRCLLNDAKIRAGLEAIRQAQADWLTASLPPNPELNVAGILLPLNRPYTVAAPGGPSEFDVGVSYPLDWLLFGKRAAAMTAACWGVRVSEAEYADLVRQRVTEAAVTFYDVLEAQALVEVADQDLENLERVETATRKAVENGGRPLVELHRVRLELLTTRRTRRDAETAWVTARTQLRALFGDTEADPTFTVVGTLDGPVTATPMPLEESVAIAVEGRPDIQALRRKVARAQADTVVERRNALPEVTPDIGLGHQFQQSIGAPDVTTWGTGLGVSVPLFNRNQGNRVKATSVLTQSHYELQLGLIELRAELEQAAQALRAAQQNAASVAQEELRLAEQVYDSIQRAYEAGGRPLLDALDARRNYRETYRIYVTSRAEYWRAFFRYQAALGEQLSPDTNAEPIAPAPR